MDWIFLLLGSVCFVEIFIRLNSLSLINSLGTILNRVTRVIRSSRISDHWKERVLPRYSLALFKQSLLIFAVLVASFLIFPVLGLVSELLNGQFIALSTSALGITASTCIALSYATLRSKASKDSDAYSFGSKILHHISLGAPFVGEALFDLEKSLYASKSPEVSADKHVFVCGLARAGTTVLMRRLYESEQFCSLTYRDMPFVLAPNLWRRSSKHFWKSKETQERAHGDGLMVNYDSPEALEEVFWKTQCGSDYIKEDCLVPMSADEGVLQDFRTYVSLVMRESTGKRYLSKNNNNILRLRSIIEAFPQATILIPFRKPEQQVYSLLHQHQRFTELHSTDHFASKYMTWLVHHEFGADHRPFRFEQSEPQAGDPAKFEYWLNTWVNTYTSILDRLPPQALLVCYETLCSESEMVWKNLAERIDVAPDKGDLTFSGAFHEINYSSPTDLLERANQLYSHMVSRAIGNGPGLSSQGHQ